MSRHTNMKGFMDEAEEEEIYTKNQKKSCDGEYDDLDPEDETYVENIEYQFSNQIPRNTIVDVLDSEEWDRDICEKIFKELVEFKNKYPGLVKIDKLSNMYYDLYWNKKDMLLKLEQMNSEKLKKEQEKQQKEQKKLQENLKKQQSQESTGQIRKQSTTLTRKESQEYKKEIQIEKQLSRDHHSIKIERFQQETNKALYNQVYEPVDHKYKVSPEEQEHTQINLVTVGHVDSGKSTLVGHLRHLMNEIDKREMHKLEKTSNEKNKQSFKYAYGQDEFEAERDRGVTIDVGFKTMKTKKNEINFLDSPGHRDFVPNMISGTAQADYAMLVIDSGPNAFEGGFERGGQTKEHAYLIKAFGVDKVVLVINKMDLHQWSKERYMEVTQKVMDYLIGIGFSSSQVRSIPISGFQGHNLVQRCKQKEASWYNGPCLIELLESLQPPKRAYERPLRLNVYSAANKKNVSGLTVSGKIEGGVIQKGDKIVCQPHGIIGAVKDITLDFKKTHVAKAGDNIEALIQLKHDTEEIYINSGNVICGMKQAIPVTKKVVIEFVAFDLIYPVLKGAEVMVYINTSRSDGIMHKITKLIDKDNGNVLKKNPKCIKSHECAEIQIYGRVILRDNKQTIGVGTIKEIL